MKQLLAKIKNDRYYSELFDEVGFDIYLHGFFNDGLPESINYHESMKMLCTPLNHIKQPKTNKHCVLVSTGAMDPVHQGHVDMMQMAKLRLERDGYEVLGGYICPSHDSYVSTKNDVSNNISVRGQLISNILQDMDWLALDPWSGVFVGADINFTDIIERTKLYLHTYLGLDTEIVYVCGSDRYNFARTFKYHGKCVVVTRQLFEQLDELPNTLIAFGNNSLSSTILREASANKPNISNIIKRLVLRDDGTKLFDTFYNYFNSIDIVNVTDQKEQFDKINDEYVISIDSMIPGKYNLQTSRIFDIFGHTKIGRFFGDSNIVEDTDNEYVLYDDDIHTGQTMLEVEAYLSLYFGIEVYSNLTFNQSNNNSEILDNRDFMVFGENCGLMIQINGTNYRVPYIYPFVDPSIRCSIYDPLNFSIDIWHENIGRYGDMILADTPQHDFYKMLGFNSTDYLDDICEYYCNQLKNLTK